MSFMKLTGKEKKDQMREETSGVELPDDALEEVAGGRVGVVPTQKRTFGGNTDSKDAVIIPQAR